MLALAGIRPPAHAFAGARPPFVPGRPVVLKGLAEELWHKSELGAVKFMAYDEAAIAAESAAMKARVEAAGRRWIGALVCERVGCRAGRGPAGGGVLPRSCGTRRDGSRFLVSADCRRRPSPGWLRFCGGRLGS